MKLKAIASTLLMFCVAVAPAHARTFKHVVIVIQENRTPDNLFGSNSQFEPGVDIATSGLNSSNQVVPLTAVDLAGCYDIGHGHVTFVKAYNNGLMNGWDKEGVSIPPGCVAGANPQFRYVDNSTGTVQPYFDLAKQYGFANRMFQTNQGPSFPAHQFLFGGTSAPSADSALFVSENPHALHSPFWGCASIPGTYVYTIDPNGVRGTTFPCFDRPTLADLLDGAGLTWKYYTPGSKTIITAPNAIKAICNAQVVNGSLVCTGTEWAKVVVLNPSKTLVDIGNCNLANVNWVVPIGANSDHAVGNTGGGPSWVASIVNAIGTASCPNGEMLWQDTAIFVTWDDWGGWYDHVPPFRIGQSNGWGQRYVYGFRVPLLVISAYTPAGYVDNTVHDFGSILRFVESNFNLGLIGAGKYADSYADDLMEFFPLTEPRSFRKINSKYDANHFILSTEPMTDPDDD
jgi:phospholipase C